MLSPVWNSPQRERCHWKCPLVHRVPCELACWKWVGRGDRRFRPLNSWMPTDIWEIPYISEHLRGPGHPHKGTVSVPQGPTPRAAQLSQESYSVVAPPRGSLKPISREVGHCLTESALSYVRKTHEFWEGTALQRANDLWHHGAEGHLGAFVEFGEVPSAFVSCPYATPQVSSLANLCYCSGGARLY